jgi:hypothetical protein
MRVAHTIVVMILTIALDFILSRRPVMSSKEEFSVDDKTVHMDLMRFILTDARQSERLCKNSSGT